MNKNSTNVVAAVLVYTLALFTITQGLGQGPVVCLESDGHINFELGCDKNASGVDILPKERDGHQDDCTNCTDIPIWTSDANLQLTKKSNPVQFNIGSNLRYPSYISYVDKNLELNSSPDHPSTPTDFTLTLLRTTILII